MRETNSIFDFDYQIIDGKIIKYPLLYCNKSQFKNQLGNVVFKEFIGNENSIFISTNAINLEQKDSFEPFIKDDFAIESVNFAISYLKYLKIDYNAKYYINAIMIDDNKMKRVIAFSDSRRISHPTTIFIQNTENIFDDDCFINSIDFLVRAKYNLELDAEYFKYENICALREIISCINY